MKEFVKMHSPLCKIYEYVTITEAVVVAWGGGGGIPENFARGVASPHPLV